MSHTNHGQCYQTDEKSIRRGRASFGVTMVAAPLVIILFLLLTRSDLRMALLLVPVAWGVTLVNGTRMVVGIGTCSESLKLFTPLSQHEIPWNRVRISRYPFRTDIYVAGRLMWPFMVPTGGKRGREMYSVLQRHVHD